MQHEWIQGVGAPFRAHCIQMAQLGGSLESIETTAMADVPGEMTAIAIREPGGPNVLVAERRPVPRPGPGELLIRVVAGGVNRPDVLQRMGRYPPPPGAPDIPGLEVSGIVAALGEGVDGALMGSRVCALLAGGGYAEYALAPVGQCLSVPDKYDLVEAAALPETLFTVWTNLFERAYVAEGDTVLIHGGTSGIGTMAVALCGLFGITSIVTCGSDQKCKAALAWGASHAVNYHSADFVKEIARITGSKGCDAVLDMVGGDYLPRNLQCLAEDGRHVSIAVLGGPKAEIFIPSIMSRRLTLTGSTLRPRSVLFKSLVADELRRVVWPFVESGALRPAMDMRFPLAEASKAHARMDSGDHMGKIVLVME
jgi:putative PIG3 family NAD(P)H quinone oxidoreductase